MGNDEKAINVGMAAHITAAAPGGPRYDPLLTREQRRHISNGIWLCYVHGKQIDSDDSHFTVEKLREWKDAAERKSAFAIMMLQVPHAYTADAAYLDQSIDELARRLGLPLQDTLPTVIARLRTAALNDLAAFVSALRSPTYAIPLDLRMTDSERVSSFQAIGLAAAIQTFNEIIVVAAPGTGKTTTMLQVVQAILGQGDFVAAFIPLSEWAFQTDSLLQSVVRRAAFGGEREEHLKFLANSGRLFLVMDGWNELDAPSKKRARADIQALQRDYPSLGIFMSTRAQALDVPIAGPTVEIEPLSEGQQLAIAQAMRGAAGESILDHAWRTRGVRDLVAIPLYLTTLLAHAPGDTVATTKEEVLRLFVTEHERTANKAEALEATTFGFHSDMLKALAAEATRANSVTLPESRARAVIAQVERQLADDGQISATSQPLAVLNVLVSHHLLVRTGAVPAGFAFQHQQFQEWYASFEVEQLMRASATGDQAAKHSLRANVLDMHVWEESVLFACERASRADANGVKATACLVLEALAIDPMLAAEAIYRSSDALWSSIKDKVITFANKWHATDAIDRAVRFMIKSGRSEFAEPLWLMISNPDEQISLQALRAGPRFRPSVLGSDSAQRIAQLPPEQRALVLSELVFNGGIEGLDLATNTAVSDNSATVQAAVIGALLFRQANRHVQKVLAAASDEVWQQLAREGYAAEIVAPGAADRLRLETARNIETEHDPLRKLHALVAAGRSGMPASAEIETLIETVDFAQEHERGAAVIREASKLYPADVRAALIRRLENGLPIPFHAESLLHGTGTTIDDGPLVDLVLLPDTDRRLVHGAVGVVGTKTIGRMIDAVIALDEEIKQMRAARQFEEATGDGYQRIVGFLAGTELASFASAILSRASTSEPERISLLADLFARHGESGTPVPMHLDVPIRNDMIAAVGQWADILLASPEADRSHLANVSRAIERLAAPELVERLTKMLAHDLARWRQERESQIAARAKGIQSGGSGAYMSWTLQYGRAFAAIGGDRVVAVMRAYLPTEGHGNFGLDAANVLKELWAREEQVPSGGPFASQRDFSEVRSRRAQHQNGAGGTAAPFAEDIFGVIDQLILPESPSDSQLHALQLACVAISMPYGDKRATIHKLLKLPQPLSAKLGLLTALVRAGEVIDSSMVIDGIRDLLEEAKTTPWLLDGLGRWLTLLPFTDKPEATLDVLLLLAPNLKHPRSLSSLISGLGHAPSAEAEHILIALAQQDSRFLSDYDWLAAMENRGSLSSSRFLLDLMCQDAAQGATSARDTWGFARKVATAIQMQKDLRADVYQRLDAAPTPRARLILEDAVAEAPDEEGVMLLIRTHARDGRSFDGLLRSAVEHLAVGRRPSSDWIGAHELVSEPIPALRKRLFALAIAGGPEALIAASCLNAVDELRDEHGPAEGETRHPDIGVGLPWPLLQ